MVVYSTALYYAHIFRSEEEIRRDNGESVEEHFLTNPIIDDDDVFRGCKSTENNVDEQLRDTIGCDGCDSTERQVDEIQVHVIGWRRPDATKALLERLEDSNYTGWNVPVPLYIHLDGGALPEVVTLVHEFQWNHGKKYVNSREENVGLREMWLSSIGAISKVSGDNALMIVFEDDMTVSLDYFQWILAVVDAYGRSPHCRDTNLMGFSLSPIRVDEMKKPFRRWDARNVIRNGSLAYLSVVPSSWGAAYWSDKWNDFAEFTNVRMKSPYYNVEAEHITLGADNFSYENLNLTPKELFIPGARSNFWPKSWKRFMVDFMYARGLVMVSFFSISELICYCLRYFLFKPPKSFVALQLYPNLPGEEGFATTLALPGEHVGSSSTWTNPNVAVLWSFQEKDLSIDVMRRSLPKYRKLDVLGLHLKPTSRERLLFFGSLFLHSVQEKCLSCDELVRAWARPGTRSDQDYVASFSICAPDMYMTQATASQFQTNWTDDVSQASQRYLLFEPQYGMNNQLYAIVEAMKWAKALNRQLVMPPIFLPRVSEFEHDLEWPKTESLLQLAESDGSDDYHQPLGFQKWLELNIPVHRKLRISRVAYFDKTTRVLADAILKANHVNGTNIPTVDIRHLIGSGAASLSDQVKFHLGGCRDQVLAFEGLYFVSMNYNETAKDNFDLMNNVLKLSETAQRTYDTVKLNLHEELGGTSYACYHVRLGDFESFCDEVTHSQNPKYAYFTNLVNEGYKCSITADELVSTITDVGMPALIISNNVTAFEDKLGTVDMATVSSGWVDRKVTENLPLGMNEAEHQLLTLLVEQELCGEAEYLRLNRFSTFSQRIVSMSKARGGSLNYWLDEVKWNESMI